MLLGQEFHQTAGSPIAAVLKCTLGAQKGFSFHTGQFLSTSAVEVTLAHYRTPKLSIFGKMYLLPIELAYLIL